MEFRRYPDLASARLGGRALAANDEFFAPKENLVKPEPPAFDPDRYTDRGKWMDGWETRRRREPGHDWVVVRLGVPGIVRGVVVDTRHFKGNHPEKASVDACAIDSDDLEEASWREIVPLSPLAPDAENVFPVDDTGRSTHIRLRIHPDGGVARLRVHGEAAPDWQALPGPGPIDLASVVHGGVVLAASDEFFGAPVHLILPGDPAGMHDGWETRRRRGPGHDWVALRLGHRGRIVRAEIDTRFFKGNYPESASLEVADAEGAAEGELLVVDDAWRPILPRTRLGPDAVHVFEPPALTPATATHARLDIYPDGGVARLRLFGEVDA